MIEQQIREHMLTEKALQPYLATYAGQMAIFNQEAPADTDPNWETKNQYGRVVFTMRMEDDPERNYSGTLAIDIICPKEQGYIPEETEPIIRNLIDGYFFSNSLVTIAAQWKTSAYFQEPTKKEAGATLSFALLAFPTQATTYPDPIELINKWSADELPKKIGKEKVMVIGRDNLPPAWKPTREAPAIFWRLGTINKCNFIPDTYNASWQTAKLWGHIMSPEINEANAIARTIANTLTIQKRLIFDDLSPLMIDRGIQLNLSSDPLRVGQISIDATYGILNVPETVKPPIADIGIGEKGRNSGR